MSDTLEVTSDLIVIGFDGTPASERAVREAATLFATRQALVVTVWEAERVYDLALVPTRGLELPLCTLDLRVAAQLDRARYEQAQRLAGWGAQLATENGLKAEALAVADELSVADTLLRLAKERDAAAVAVGTHRQGRLAELLIGSTTKSLIRHALCPVLVASAE